jgi:hypothetical protein
MFPNVDHVAIVVGLVWSLPEGYDAEICSSQYEPREKLWPCDSEETSHSKKPFTSQSPDSSIINPASHSFTLFTRLRQKAPHPTVRDQARSLLGGGFTFYLIF